MSAGASGPDLASRMTPFDWARIWNYGPIRVSQLRGSGSTSQNDTPATDAVAV